LRFGNRNFGPPKAGKIKGQKKKKRIKKRIKGEKKKIKNQENRGF